MSTMAMALRLASSTHMMGKLLRSCTCIRIVNVKRHWDKRLAAGVHRYYLTSATQHHRSSCQRNLLQCQLTDGGQRRAFWGLDVAFNKVDEERVKLAGPDRACAEWVLRNGGSIKWTTSSKHLKDYNMLPSIDFDSYKIEEIDLTATNVIGLGFEHLKNLNHVRSIKLHGCRTIQDDALGHLHNVKDTLQRLEVSKCPMVTRKGLAQLEQLKKLKNAVIYDLIEIKSFDSVISSLQSAMPWCQFDTKDPLAG